jgi:hypothetical protein
MSFESDSDATFGFEEFRRDAEDAGEWTPVQFYADKVFFTSEDTYVAAERSVHWLAEILAARPALRRHPA